MPCKSEGAQISGTKTISHLRGYAGLLPHEILEFLTLDNASEASYSRFEASFIVQGILYIRHIRGLSHLHPPDFSTYGVNCKVHRYICKVERGALVFELGGRRDGWK